MKYFRLPSKKGDSSPAVLIYDADTMRMYRYDTRTSLWLRSARLEYDYHSYQSFDSIGYEVETITKQEAFALTEGSAEPESASVEASGDVVGYTFAELTGTDSKDK